MTEAIAREVAEVMVFDWASALGVTLEPGTKERITRAVMAGRLDYSGDAFRYRLAAPVKLDNGETVAELTVAEPTAGQLRESSRGNREGMDAAMRILSGVTGQPLAVIDRLKQRDVMLLSELIGFFG